jgi:hypothetical protein
MRPLRRRLWQRRLRKRCAQRGHQWGYEADGGTAISTDLVCHRMLCDARLEGQGMSSAGLSREESEYW